MNVDDSSSDNRFSRENATNGKDQETAEKLWQMIHKYRFAMMTTQEEGGALRSRPMTTIERNFDGLLWFFARGDSAAVTALSQHPEVCLSYSDGRSDFVAVSGPASVTKDIGKKHELWSPSVQAWFPEGPESAKNVLVRVKPEHAEYWDSASNKLVQLFSIAKALTTGSPPQGVTEHRTVVMADSHKPDPRKAL